MSSPTVRLYYHDCYLTAFRARVVDTAPGNKIYLDCSAFYPDSGGQPSDAGAIAGVPVIDVIDEQDRMAHVLAAESPAPGAEVDCLVDFTRRFDHMQQHTGQHLLSAVLIELFGAPTLSFHLGKEASTIEIGVAALAPDQIAAAERRANQLVFEDRAVSVDFEAADTVAGLRKASEREGELRIVSIDGLDRSACGGTHVRRTGEIGPILIRKLDRIRGNLRIEFLCGQRAVERARADYAALGRIAQLYSSSLDEAPALAVAAQARLADAEKAARKLALELAGLRGCELHRATEPAGPRGLRSVEREVAGALDDVIRAEAQGFVSGGGAVFLAWSREPSSLLLAASADAGINAGAVVKQALAAAGGRGGGNAQLAQGSVPDASRLDAVLQAIRTAAAAHPGLPGL